MASKLTGVKADKDRKISDWLRSSMARTMTFLIMSHDDAGGHIRLNDQGQVLGEGQNVYIDLLLFVGNAADDFEFTILLYLIEHC